jgi:signal transduction histidine kinase
MTKRLVIAMTVLGAVISLALAIPLGVVISNDRIASFVDGLEIETLGTASLMSSEPYIDWQATADAAAERTGARVVVVDSELNLVADSDDSGLDRSFDRPEVAAALSGDLTSDVRFSETLNTDLRYVAAPIVQNFQVVAAVRLSLSETDAYADVRTAVMWLIVFVASVVIGAAFLAVLLAQTLAAPVLALTEVVKKLPTDLTARANEKAGPKEIRNAATALNQTAARLDGIVERTQRVAADASHHLRTPLTGVRLRLEAISDLAQDEAVHDDAEAAIAEVDRLAHRIDQILTLTRADSGTTTLQMENLGAIVTERCLAAGVIAEEKGIEIVTTVQDCSVHVPAGTCGRIIDELLGNAMAYAQHEIRVSVVTDGQWAVMSVSDDGPGLADPTDVDKLFGRFYRSKNAIAGGSGLGLALVRESARLAGGDAKAQMLAQGGLSISVNLPLDSN